METCKTCGRAIETGTHFCPNCGAPVEDGVVQGSFRNAVRPEPMAAPSSPPPPWAESPAEEGPENTSMPMGFYRFYKVLLIVQLFIYAIQVFQAAWGLLPEDEPAFTIPGYEDPFHIPVMYYVIQLCASLFFFILTLLARIHLPRGAKLGLVCLLTSLGVSFVANVLSCIFLPNSNDRVLSGAAAVEGCLIFAYFWKRRRLFHRWYVPKEE